MMASGWWEDLDGVWSGAGFGGKEERINTFLRIIGLIFF